MGDIDITTVEKIKHFQSKIIKKISMVYPLKYIPKMNGNEVVNCIQYFKEQKFQNQPCSARQIQPKE